MKESYIIYVESYGKVQSGKTLDRNDFGEIVKGGLKQFDDKGKLAVSLAVQDVKLVFPMRTKKDFEEQIKKLLGE